MKNTALTVSAGVLGTLASGILVALALGCLPPSQVSASPGDGSSSGGAAHAPTEAPAQALASAMSVQQAFAAVAAQVSPSVVSIRVEARRENARSPFHFFAPFGGGAEEMPSIQQGSGSGVIIRPDGHILTNNHVVADATHIEVEVKDGRRFAGRVVGRDTATDLAVIAIDADALPAARFAESSDVHVGDWAIAIGSPFGLDYTLTAGIVSAIGRAGLGSNEIEDYLQTDASINPGNSGGPLVNLRGEVIGINTMIVGRGTGIGFAIQADLARLVSDQIIGNGKVERAWLGVSFQELTPRLAKQLGAPTGEGALVSSVLDEGPAAKAGLKAGDVVISLDGKSVRSGRELQKRVLQAKVGQTTSVEVLRDGKKQTLSVQLGERPTRGDSEEAEAKAEPALLGLEARPLDDALASRLRLPTKEGLLITKVLPGTPAGRAGLQRGDVIIEIDRHPAATIEDLRKGLSDGEALLRVRRGKAALFVVLSSR